MKRISITGLALVAVLAVGVATAASASATPGWYECKKESGGAYEKGCGKEGGKGGYSIVSGIGKGKGFKGKGGEVILHMVIPGEGDQPFVCSSFKDSGSYALPNKVEDVKITFSKCKAAGIGCQSGSEREEIETEPLAGELGYIHSEGPAVGVDLTNEANPGAGYIAVYECVGLAKIRVHGSVIGQMTGDVNEFSKESETVFTVGEYFGEPDPGYKPLVNVPEFEGGSTDVLLNELNAPQTHGEWSEPIPAGWQATLTNKGEELEIKA